MTQEPITPERQAAINKIGQRIQEKYGDIEEPNTMLLAGSPPALPSIKAQAESAGLTAEYVDGKLKIGNPTGKAIDLQIIAEDG